MRVPPTARRRGRPPRWGRAVAALCAALAGWLGGPAAVAETPTGAQDATSPGGLDFSLLSPQDNVAEARAQADWWAAVAAEAPSVRQWSREWLLRALEGGSPSAVKAAVAQARLADQTYGKAADTSERVSGIATSVRRTYDAFSSWPLDDPSLLEPHQLFGLQRVDTRGKLSQAPEMVPAVLPGLPADVNRAMLEVSPALPASTCGNVALAALCWMNGRPASGATMPRSGAHMGTREVEHLFGGYRTFSSLAEVAGHVEAMPPGSTGVIAGINLHGEDVNHAFAYKNVDGKAYLFNPSFNDTRKWQQY